MIAASSTFKNACSFANHLGKKKSENKARKKNMMRRTLRAFGAIPSAPGKPVNINSVVSRFREGLSPLFNQVVARTDMDPSFFTSSGDVLAMPFCPQSFEEIRSASVFGATVLCWAQAEEATAVQLVQCNADTMNENIVALLDTKLKCVVSMKVSLMKPDMATIRFLVREVERNRPFVCGSCTFSIANPKAVS